MKIKPYDFMGILLAKYKHVEMYFPGGCNIGTRPIDLHLKGFSALGFSGHSFTRFDLECCIPCEKEQEYFAQCRRLQEKYKDKIDILCGIERDIYADNAYPDADYVIGSVHYLKVNKDKFLAVDMDKETQIKGVNDYFGGDYLSFCESYFETVSKLSDIHKTDIIGHFDLVKIYNGDGALFDENSERYITAAKKAVDKLIKNDVLFEINTGAVFRGRRHDPYPSQFILEYIALKGGKVILSGDSHCPKALGFNFEKSVELAKKCGFKSIYTLTKSGKKELEI